MRILTIAGSPHGSKGNTARLTDAVLEAIRAQGAQTEIVWLKSSRVLPCRACDVCHKTGTCPQDDAFESIKKEMLAADGIVLASPNYIVSVTAQMKALMDRCCGILHCQMMEGKYAVAVVSSGGPESAPVESYMLQFLRVLGCWTVGSVGASAWQLSDAAPRKERTRVLAEAGTLGERLVQAIQQKDTFPDQAAERRTFAQRMKELVTMRKDEWDYEYKYWQAHGAA